MTQTNTITQRELQNRFGWSRYLTQKVCTGLEAARFNDVKHYCLEDIQSAITTYLERPKLHKKTRILLNNTSDRLEGKSNVIEVDFLKKFSFEEEMTFLMDQRQQILARGKETVKGVEALLEKIDRMGLG